MTITHEIPSDSPLQQSAATSETVQLCLTDTERIGFQKAAERCGLSLTAWIRDRLNECAKREAKES